jgi:hypothetical protein
LELFLGSIEDYRRLKKSYTSEHYFIVSTEFSTICYDAFEEKVIEIGLRDIDLLTSLRPHVFDSLKRINRLTLIKKSIVNFMCKRKCVDEKWFHLKQIEERDLICSTIQSLNLKAKAKFGALLAKNDYPCPLVFNEYKLKSIERNPFNYNLYFELFYVLLGLKNKSICVVSGTKNCNLKGKSSLIPIIFDGINSVSVSRKDHLRNNNNVDLIASNTNDWLIADFHGEIEIPDFKNLLKSFVACSTLHIMNVTIIDLKKNGEFEGELKEIFEWYHIFHEKSAAMSAYLIILIRDYDDDDGKLLANISRRVSKRFTSVITVPYISCQEMMKI